MKKTLLAFTTAIFSLNGLFAQITLTQSSFTTTFAGTVDTFLSSGTGTTNPSMVPATNANWDMTTAVLTTPVGYNYNVNPYTAAFASAQFADSIKNSFSAYQYIATFQRAFTAAGFLEYGEHVNRQSVNLPSASTDSLIFIAQNVLYSTPNQLIKFPCTSGSTWTTAYNLSFGFMLDVALFSYTNEPGSVKEYITELDSVVGWGQMKVKKTDGTGSGYQNVLQIRKRIVQVDSFFINGSSAPPTLLTAFSLTQGSRTGQYFATYYRPNEAYPLADVYYTDSTFGTISGVQTLAQDYNSDLTGVKAVIAGENITVFPNPVLSNEVNIILPGTIAGNWTYELTDLNGAQVQAGALPVSNGNSTQLVITGTMTPGLYFLHLNNNGVEVAVKTLSVTK